MQKKWRKGGLMSVAAIVVALSMVGTSIAFAEPDKADSSDAAMQEKVVVEEASVKEAAEEVAEKEDLQKIIIALGKDEEKDDEAETEVVEAAKEADSDEEEVPAVKNSADEETVAEEKAEKATAAETKEKEEVTKKAETEAAVKKAVETKAEAEEAKNEKLDTVGVADAVKTVTNLAEKVNLTVKCAWIDSQDQDGFRPEGVYMTIYANGVPSKVVCVTEDDGWQLTLTDLFKYDADGNPIQYSVSASTVKGYLTKIVGCVAYHFRAPEKINICGVKTWDDADNKDGIRPSSITVRLFAFGKYATYRTATVDSDWHYCFLDCPKYCEGVEIPYTIVEDGIEGYETEIVGFDIINHHVPESESVPVSESPSEPSTDETEPVTEELTSEPVTEEPTSEPITEEPTTEEPTSEPITEEPTTEEPTTEEPTSEPITEEPTTEEPTTEEPSESASEEPTTEEPTTEEPSESASEEPTTEEPSESASEEPSESQTEEPSENQTEKPSESQTVKPSTQATTKTPDKPGKEVKTGDSTRMMVWFVTMMVSVVGVMAVVILRKRRNSR